MRHQNYQQIANSYARKYGHGRATKIRFDYIDSPALGEIIRRGYRKNTTGEYVPRAYLSHFGWKNTYYQNKICEVVLPIAYESTYPIAVQP